MHVSLTDASFFSEIRTFTSKINLVKCLIILTGTALYGLYKCINGNKPRTSHWINLKIIFQKKKTTTRKCLRLKYTKSRKKYVNERSQNKFFFNFQFYFFSILAKNRVGGIWETKNQRTVALEVSEWYSVFPSHHICLSTWGLLFWC